MTKVLDTQKSSGIKELLKNPDSTPKEAFGILLERSEYISPTELAGEGILCFKEYILRLSNSKLSEDGKELEELEKHGGRNKIDLIRRNTFMGGVILDKICLPLDKPQELLKMLSKIESDIYQMMIENPSLEENLNDIVKIVRLLNNNIFKGEDVRITAARDGTASTTFNFSGKVESTLNAN